MTTELNTVADYIQAAKDGIARAENLRLVNTIAAHNTVVLSATGFALDFDWAPAGKGKRTATAARIVPLWKAPQFSPASARELAKFVNNGTARAVFINDAVNEYQAAQHELIGLLEAHKAA